MTLAADTQRLQELARANLQGAELLATRLLDRRPYSDDERVYIVLWKRDDIRVEYGTHRAVLHNDGRGMLVWGHYFTEADRAEADFDRRGADGR